MPWYPTTLSQQLVISVQLVPAISVRRCHPFRFKPCHFFKLSNV